MDEHADPAKVASFASYADKHEIFDIFHYMMQRLLISKPEDPIQFMVELLKKPKTPAVILVGPPTSTKKSLGKLIANHLGCVHIDSGELLRIAIEDRTGVGIQAKSYLEKNQLVPDMLVFNLVLPKLVDDPAVAEKGFVLEGYPRTKEQALQLQRRGIFPSHFVLLDAPDEVIVRQADARRIDPSTGEEYDLLKNPPPESIASRVIQRSRDTEASVRKRLQQFRQSITGVLSCYPGLRKFTFNNGIDGNEDEIFRQVIEYIGLKEKTRAPRCFKVGLLGLPGSGKTSLAKLLSEKYGFVHVSPKTVILEQLSAKTKEGDILANFIENPEDAPESTLMEVMLARLNMPDCKERGWVLDGFPFNAKQAEILAKQGLAPNRIFHLNSSAQTCTDRLTHRRYDPVTGRVINVLQPPTDIPSSELGLYMQRPEDSSEHVSKRISRSNESIKELIAFYGTKKHFGSLFDPGLVHRIEGDGLGEGDGFGVDGFFDRDASDKRVRRLAPSLLKTFERAEAALTRPIPVDLEAK